MNILFITSFKVDPNKGGVQRVTFTLAKAFMKKNYKVSFLALIPSTEEKVEDFTQYYLPGKKYYSNDNINYIKNLLKEKKINVIINQTGIFPKAFKLIHAAILPGIKLFTVHHNCIACLVKNYRQIALDNKKDNILLKIIDNSFVWSILIAWHKLRYRFYYKKIIENSTKLVLLSKHFIPELKSTYLKKFDENKVIAIPNPAPFEIQKDIEEKKENRLVYVGRINYQQKRTDLLLDIWERLYKKFSDWELDVVGDGPLKLKLEEEAKKRRIERINFYGYQDPRPYLEKAKFFLMTSAFEGYGMVLVEAQAYGAVPFAFDTFSAVYDVISDKSSGVIVEAYDVEKYISELSLLINNDEKRIEMIKNCFETVNKFLPVNVADLWIDEFKK